MAPNTRWQRRSLVGTTAAAVPLAPEHPGAVSGLPDGGCSVQQPLVDWRLGLRLGPHMPGPRLPGPGSGVLVCQVPVPILVCPVQVPESSSARSQFRCPRQPGPLLPGPWWLYCLSWLPPVCPVLRYLVPGPPLVRCCAVCAVSTKVGYQSNKTSHL